MKKLITGILALTMSVACFAGVTACSDKDKAPISSSSEDNTAKLEALESAGEYLKELYREDVKAVSRDYTLPNTTSYDGTTFNVTWSVKVTKGAADSVKVEAGDEETLINVNEATEEEIEYVLTATISDDDDNSVTVDFNCKVNVIVADSIIAPVENTAYNMYIEHKGAYKNLLLTGKMDSQDKFFEMTMDNSKAANVYAENATGGYKFYIKGENDAKSYITLTEYKKEGKDYYGAHVSFSETGSVFYYDAVGCWACELENDTYFLGSYGTFETASASSSYYMTAENIGRNQFPLLIALPGDFVGGEIESELELPAADSELTIAQALEVAGKFEHDTYTKDKYYVTATVVEVTNTTYGNMTVTDGTDTLTVYGTYDSTGAKKYGEMTETKPVAGDTVKLYGVLGTYNGTNQMKNGWIKSVTPGSGNQGGGEGGSTVVPETDAATILNKLYALADGETATGDFTLTGKITALDSYNNPTIVVEGFESKPVLCYYLKVDNAVGDTITVKATGMKNFKGTYEFTNCTLISSVAGGGSTGGDSTGGDTTVTIPEANTTVSIPDAIAIGNSLGGKYTEGKYYVEGSVKSIASTTYGNLTIEDTNGNSIYVYGTYSGDGVLGFSSMKTKPAVGDNVKLYGVIGSYSGTAQLKNAWIVTINGNSTLPTNADKVAHELNKLSVTSSVTGAQNITLAKEAANYSDVTISWEVTVDESDIATLTENVLAIANPTANATVTVTATLVCGEETDTKSFEIAVTAASSDEVSYSADFNTFNTNENSSYKDRTTTSGWSATNAAFFATHADLAVENAIVLNGKTSTLGSLTSPLLENGLKRLSFKYGFMFGDTNLKLTINIKNAEGTVIATDTIERTDMAKGTVYEYSKEFNVTGSFTIEILNKGKSNSSSKNKDRVGIWNLTWVNA